MPVAFGERPEAGRAAGEVGRPALIDRERSACELLVVWVGQRPPVPERTIVGGPGHQGMAALRTLLRGGDIECAADLQRPQLPLAPVVRDSEIAPGVRHEESPTSAHDRRETEVV